MILLTLTSFGMRIFIRFEMILAIYEVEGYEADNRASVLVSGAGNCPPTGIRLRAEVHLGTFMQKANVRIYRRSSPAQH